MPHREHRQCRADNTVIARLVLSAALAGPVVAAGQQVQELAGQLRAIDARVIVLGAVRRPPLEGMLATDVEARLRAANRADRFAWQEVKTRADWDRFLGRRLEALRKSLGEFPPMPKDLKLRVTGTHEGDGYHVDNLVFQSRPGLVVTANLYRPKKSTASMPGVLICHSHQSTKHTSWRQDMAMTWARAGCVVLVPDHLGHGERRQHPFGSDAPHDYHFRYDAGMQLHVVGESLMGWLVYDLKCGVDVLLSQKGVDAKRIILISEPAGGGDVAAVTAALDTRITGVMVQNFGGPEPENAYPLSRDAEESFDYAGSGSWESTRNLRLSARDGFLPWTLVAASAPRRLIYFHEFYWDRDQDPVWKRLQRVFELRDAKDALVGLAGRGFVVGAPPENSHWLPMNRESLYPVLERWFAIPNPKKEYSKRLPVENLLCLTAEARRALGPQALHVLGKQVGAERTAAARKERQTLSLAERRARLRQEWTRLLGDVTPQARAVVKGAPLEPQQLGKVTVERIHLGTEPGIVVPAVLLLPARPKGERVPVVVAIAQQGKQEFLRQRAESIAELLSTGVAVFLPDVRGTGETSPGDARDRRSAATSISASEWMLGQSLLGARLRDLRSLLDYLRRHEGVDGKRIALWGDSFAQENPPDTKFEVPHTAAQRPIQSEPLGGLLALLGALLEDDIRGVYLHRGLSDYASTLNGPYWYLPHDVVVPGVLAVGDISDLAGALAPMPLFLDGMVDGLNRVIADDELARRVEHTQAAYAEAKAANRLRLGQRDGNKQAPARWLSDLLQKR